MNSPYATVDGVVEPGIFYGMPFADYLTLPAFSAGVCHRLLSECPKAAWFDSHLNPGRPRDDTNASDAGTIAHAIILEGSMAGVVVIDPEDHPADKSGNIPDGWTNKSIRAARDQARLAGKTPVLLTAMLEIEAMVDSAHNFIDSLMRTEPAIYEAFVSTGGDSELSCLWDDDGLLCRMRPDRISKDRRLIVDIKTTGRSAEPDAFGRTLGPMGFRMSASFYRRGCRSLFNTSPDYVFLVIEQNAPYLCSLVGADPSQLALGDEQVESGLREWRKCVAENNWPAYPNRVAYPELRAHEVAWWQERQAQYGIPYDVAQLFERTA
ncbi:MAG TPA: PD-(D/E)XK nuclease-like domain-containing protein [Pseudolabrys sp.]|jgi:hypothetical protein|nr:PD-(D/E)XK nuclease-like domain-containing protein [Pseudolabrys sp.]